MKRSLFGAQLTAGVLAIIFVGCNAILDNKPGNLIEADEAGALPDSDASTLPGDEPNVPAKDAGPPVADADSGDASPACPPGQQMCSGTCVSNANPLYGCGSPTCAPCPSAHGTMGCQAQKCVVTACDPGFSDCNAIAADGCETDLSKSTSCGACKTACAAPTPMCTPTGPTFQCTNGCTPAAPLSCGAECVDPLTSANHCGGCNLACPVVDNATTACTAGTCSFACKPDFHACAGKCATNTDPTACGPACTPCPVPAGGAATCVADTCGITCTPPSHACGGKCTAPTDPTACGAACTVCPVPANATATCTGDTCGFTCTAGFGNCDADPANGCEATFASDPLHCGSCGKSCAGQPCVNGACQAAPPPPPPPPPPP